MDPGLLGRLFWIDSAYTLIVFLISIFICSKLKAYYELTAYEGLKYFRNSFITLIFSFFIIYLLKTIEIIKFFNVLSDYIMVRGELVLLSLLTISVLLFIYYYYMTFFFNDVKEKNKTLYVILSNEKMVFFSAFISGILFTPAVDVVILLLLCLSFYLVYRKMRTGPKRLNYFIIYNLLILSYAINLVQLVLFEIRKYFYIDILIYLLQMFIYLKIWNEVKN